MNIMRRRDIVPKTEITLQLEKAIFNETKQKNMFGCFEVTIGFDGNERVDFLALDAHGTWRFYEIKVSKSDFYSKAHNTFYGHYNYYVMPEELYLQVEGDIPDHIGVFNGSSFIKRAKKRDLGIDEQILKDSMIRSLSRENQKFFATCDIGYLNSLKSKISKLEKENRDYHNKIIAYNGVIHEICETYGLQYKEVRKIVREHI
jgi:hypothetical protein